MILHWVYDCSPDAAKTYRLVERTVPLIDRLVGLPRVPGMRGVVREALSTYRELRT